MYVISNRIAQEELKQQLDNLSEQLKAIEQIQTTPPELDVYVRKLINIKHKVTVVFSVLQGAQVSSRPSQLSHDFIY